MGFIEIFVKKAHHRFWQRLSDDHVVNGSPGKLIENDGAYFVIRMKEMYLKNTRTLWRKFYPLLHAFIEYQKGEEHAIAGPGQLRDLGEANLERVVNLNFRLSGPTPYKGGDVSLLAGLYAVPGQDAAKALIGTLSTIAGLGGIALGQIPAVANAVKTGVESVIGLNESTLQLGIRDTFYKENPLRSGYHVAIDSDAEKVKMSKLWLSKGRLVQGNDPVAAVPYEDSDYMVLEVERRDSRDDWPALPDIAAHQAGFAAIMGDSGLTVAQKREKLRDAWGTFQNTLSTSPYLVKPDAQRIALSVSEDLNARLKALESGNPFETRSWYSSKPESRKPAVFDFVDVPDYLDLTDSNSIKRAARALAGNPFA